MGPGFRREADLTYAVGRNSAAHSAEKTFTAEDATADQPLRILRVLCASFVSFVVKRFLPTVSPLHCESLTSTSDPISSARKGRRRSRAPGSTRPSRTPTAPPQC